MGLHDPAPLACFADKTAPLGRARLLYRCHNRLLWHRRHPRRRLMAGGVVQSPGPRHRKPMPPVRLKYPRRERGGIPVTSCPPCQGVVTMSVPNQNRAAFQILA